MEAKNKIKYRLTTKYGTCYETDNRGYVIKCDNVLNKENANMDDLMSWQITGIRKLKAFNNLGFLIRLDEASKLQKFTFKNGNPKYTIEDIDNGTRRIHGNTKYHGIIAITEVYIESQKLFQ